MLDVAFSAGEQDTIISDFCMFYVLLWDNKVNLLSCCVLGNRQ